jgi:hypothetical protein
VARLAAPKAARPSLPLLLTAVALPLAPVEAAPAAPHVLDQPACRAALDIAADAPADRLLSADPGLAQRMAAIPACRSPGDPLARLEQLEQDLASSRARIAAQQAQLLAETARQEALAQDLAQLRRQLGAPPVASVPAPVPVQAPAPVALASPAVQASPGRGFTLQAGGSSLQVRAEAKLLGFSSSRYTFNPGQPLVVSPKTPEATYDVSAQQSTVSALFRGPRWGAWTPGGYALFTLQDNLLAEGYSFTPVAFYGEISDGGWRVAAGQNFDVFAPRDPDTLPSGKLAATGNPGAYRPQFRLERNFEAGESFGGVLQLAAASPITTALPKELDLANLPKQELVEDNGWPNVEGRLNLGFGAPAERAGGRRLRPLELGLSGLVGQLRVLDNIRRTDPLRLVNDRTVLTVWGAAVDGQLALGRRVALSGELYTGQGLGEYMAGIFQTYNRASNRAVPTSGGWGQLAIHAADNVKLALGYGIDNASDPGRFGLQLNSTVFANLVWDVNAWLQLGLEGNYKFTTYDSFGDKEAWLVISQVMFRL